MKHLTIDEIVEHTSKGADKHYFTPNAMRGFSTRIQPRTEYLKVNTFECNVFCTSEHSGIKGSDRRFSLRVSLFDGHVVALTDFRRFSTEKSAWSWYVRNLDAIKTIIQSYDPDTCNPWDKKYQNENGYIDTKRLNPVDRLNRDVWFILRTINYR